MRASYVRAPERPLLEKTIDQVVRETAERFPDREGDGREFREFCQTQTA